MCLWQDRLWKQSFCRKPHAFLQRVFKSNGRLQGAIIMDTVMNYNNTPNSQSLPHLTQQYFPEVYGQIEADGFRGNFLSVVGREVDDAVLMDTFWYYYSTVKSGK